MARILPPRHISVRLPLFLVSFICPRAETKSPLLAFGSNLKSAPADHSHQEAQPNVRVQVCRAAITSGLLLLALGGKHAVSTSFPALLNQGASDWSCEQADRHPVMSQLPSLPRALAAELLTSSVVLEKEVRGNAVDCASQGGHRECTGQGLFGMQRCRNGPHHQSQPLHVRSPERTCALTMRRRCDPIIPRVDSFSSTNSRACSNMPARPLD